MAKELAKRGGGGFEARKIEVILGAVRAVARLAAACLVVLVNGALAGPATTEAGQPFERAEVLRVGSRLGADAAGQDGNLIEDRVHGRVEDGAVLARDRERMRQARHQRAYDNALQELQGFAEKNLVRDLLPFFAGMLAGLIGCWRR